MLKFNKLKTILKTFEADKGIQIKLERKGLNQNYIIISNIELNRVLSYYFLYIKKEKIQKNTEISRH